MKNFLIVLFILPFTIFAQTWPTKDCPDRPYTKGNDNIIYHTTNCAVVLDTTTSLIKSGEFYSDSAVSPLFFTSGSGSISSRGYVASNDKWSSSYRWNKKQKESHGFTISQERNGIPIIPDIRIDLKPEQTKIWCPFHLQYELIKGVKKEILEKKQSLLRFKDGKLYIAKS